MNTNSTSNVFSLSSILLMIQKSQSQILKTKKIAIKMLFLFLKFGQRIKKEEM